MNEFHLLGRTLEYPDEVINYAKYYSEFMLLRNEADMQFNSMYEGYGSIGNVVNKVEGDCCKIILSFSSTYIGRMVDAGFYELSEDIFFKNYVFQTKNKLEIESACDWVAEKYMEIENKKQALEEYRKERKASRTRWHGGGYGVMGAVKGATMAGTANMVSGLGHSMFNAVGNIKSSASAHAQGQKIYRSKETKHRIRNALMNDLFAVFNGYLLLMHDKQGLHFKERYADEKDRVDTIISNISQRKIGTEETMDIIADMFQTDPYNDKLYRYVLGQFGDRDLELQKLAKTFAAEPALNSYKQEIIQKITSSAERKTIEDNEKLLDGLSKEIERNGIPEEYGEPYISEIQDRIEQLKLEARTFQGVVYGSEEEALKAKEIYDLEQARKAEERKELTAWRTETDFTDKESLIQLRSKITGRNFEIDEAAKCIQEIDKCLSDIDKQERTVDGVLYENHESAQAARREKEAYEKFRDALWGELDKMFEDKKYEEAILHLKQAEVPEKWLDKLTDDWNRKVAKLFEKEIKESKKYQKIMNRDGNRNLIYGCAAILVIGFALSFKFPIAIIISLFIVVFGIWGNSKEVKDNESRKPIYDFIQQLIQYGYEIEGMGKEGQG